MSLVHLDPHALPAFFPTAGPAATLAPYAIANAHSLGRVHAEPWPALVEPFREDCHRLVQSAAFRRLSGKTQVFTGDMGDYHRTRLTHSLEVASLARVIGRALALNEDLIEALALGHDLGHPPFGHAGERVLDVCLASVGGFCHNRQALRVMTELEVCLPGIPGLNLSREVLEGQATRADKLQPSAGSPLLEVQVVEMADSLAYVTHDADDALKLGLLSIDELAQQPLWGPALVEVRRQFADLEVRELRRAVARQLLVTRVSDLLEATQARLAEGGVGSTADVRRAGWLVAGGVELSTAQRALEQYLLERVYRHPRVLAVRARAEALLRALFDRLCQTPERMPTSYRQRVPQAGLERTVGDYLAGMTDRFVEEQLRDAG